MLVPSDPLAAFLANIGYSICHQLPSRSLFLGGYQLPFCARDTGTYLAFTVVMGYYLVTKSKRGVKLFDRYVLVACLIGLGLYAFDALSSYAGLRSTSNEIRLLSGLAFGAMAGFLLTSVASIVLLRSKTTSPSYTWRDLPPVYLAIAVAGALVLVDTGVAGWYAFSVVIDAGYLVFLFLIVAIVVAVATGWDLVTKTKRKLVTTSILLEIAVIVLLWLVHYLVGTPILD
ncbi:MAG TPA: DUF2085 domain-containing protein [Methanomassiliicoccales archaeon]|nr:DUF2085 domain-containing protein [Methanomassiliicoccales archaeon]